MHATPLHLLRVHAGRGPRNDALAQLVAFLEVYVFEVEGVDVAGEVAVICGVSGGRFANVVVLKLPGR